MYEIRVESHFDSAHALRGYQGRCENLHGHRWRVLVCLETATLNDIGLAYDFTELKRRLNAVMDKLDHRFLNETPPFDRLNPSSENIARFVFQELKPLVSGVRLKFVQAWESPGASARYYEDGEA